MNSYLNLILDAEAAKQRLRKLFQSAPEPEKNDQLLAKPLAAIRKQRQRQRRSARAKSSMTGHVHYARKFGLPAEYGSVSIEAAIWIASYVLAILGLIKAAYSADPLLWLAIWPAPIVLACTVFIFFRRGASYRNGLLVLGRRSRARR